MLIAFFEKHCITKCRGDTCEAFRIKRKRSRTYHVKVPYDDASLSREASALNDCAPFM